MSEKFELFEYQKVGAQWLSERKVALLADKQRLGKSAQAISAIDIIGQPKRRTVRKRTALKRSVQSR